MPKQIVKKLDAKKHAAKIAMQNFDNLFVDHDGTLRAFLKAH